MADKQGLSCPACQPSWLPNLEKRGQMARFSLPRALSRFVFAQIPHSVKLLNSTELRQSQV